MREETVAAGCELVDTLPENPVTLPGTYQSRWGAPEFPKADQMIQLLATKYTIAGDMALIFSGPPDARSVYILGAGNGFETDNENEAMAECIALTGNCRSSGFKINETIFKTFRRP